MTEPPKRSRLEEEVLEILQRADAPPPKPVAIRSATERNLWKARLRARALSREVTHRFRAGGWSVVLAGMALAILANTVVDSFSGFLAQLFLYAGVALIVLGFVQLYRGGSRSSGGKLWRGKRIDLDGPGIDWDEKADEWRRRR